MEIGIDRDGWRQPQAGSLAGAEESRLDWHGLRARLCAAYAARRALAGAVKASAGAGSFDHESAKFLAAYGNGLCAVNRTALGNGKPPEGNDAAVAATAETGGRG